MTMKKPSSPFVSDPLLEDAKCPTRFPPDLEPRFNENAAETAANIFKALSHPVRVQILDLISQGEGEVCICDIERHFDLTQPTLSHHVKVLRDAGLIQSEQNRVWI